MASRLLSETQLLLLWVFPLHCSRVAVTCIYSWSQGWNIFLKLSHLDFTRPFPITNCVSYCSTWDPGRLCVTAGPAASRCVWDVARVCVFQDVAESRWGGERGGSQGLPSSSSPPGKHAQQPHQHYSAVRTCICINIVNRQYLSLCSLCTFDHLQFQAGGQFGAGEEGACQDRRSAELYPIGALPAQWHPHRVHSWDPLPQTRPCIRACWEHFSVPQGVFCQTLPATAQTASAE